MRRILLLAEVALVVGLVLGGGNASVLADENTSVEVYTLPEKITPGNSRYTGLYSYSHSLHGARLAGTDARNIVKTSRGRILAVILTTSIHRGGTVDGIGVYDLTDPRNIYGMTMALDTAKIESLSPERDGELAFKCRVVNDRDEGPSVIVWADPDRLERTSHDAFLTRIQDLYSWRAAKARLGSETLQVGSKSYRILGAFNSDAKGGWAFFDPDDLATDHERIRPRYYVPLMEMVQGNEVLIERRQPIGDSGFFLAYDRQQRQFKVEDGADSPATPPGGDPKTSSLPDIPKVPPLDKR